MRPDGRQHWQCSLSSSHFLLPHLHLPKTLGQGTHCCFDLEEGPANSVFCRRLEPGAARRVRSVTVACVLPGPLRAQLSRVAARPHSKHPSESLVAAEAALLPQNWSTSLRRAREAWLMQREVVDPWSLVQLPAVAQSVQAEHRKEAVPLPVEHKPPGASRRCMEEGGQDRSRPGSQRLAPQVPAAVPSRPLPGWPLPGTHLAFVS